MQQTDLIAAWYLFLFLGFVPYMAIKSARLVRAGAPVPPRPKIFRRVLVMEGIFLAVALFAASTAGIDVGSRGDIPIGAWLPVATMVVVALALQQVMWRFTPEERKRRSLLSRPNDASELGWWSAVSLAAGIVEEIVYRGVMPMLLWPVVARWMGGASPSWPPVLGGELTPAWWAAVAVCVLAFVLGHPGQGWMRAAFLAAFSIACHVLVRTTGSPAPAMALHFLYDLGAGV